MSFSPSEDDEDAERPPPPYSSEDAAEGEEDDDGGGTLKLDTGVHLTALTRAPSGRSRGRASIAGATPIERRDSSTIIA